MTTTSIIQSLEEASARRRSTRRAVGGSVLLIACGILALYLMLQNPYWVRHGDSELYLSVARNLVQGEGYRFNGQPVGIAPPGWPLVLAAALKVTSSLALLKLIPMSCLVGFLAISFLVLRRYTSTGVAAFCVFVAAMLEPVFSLSNLFFSDPLFSLVAVAAVLLAIQINEGADQVWRIVLLLLLCALAVAVRWAGLLWFTLIAGSLLVGELRPRINRRWTSAILCAAVTVATFVAFRVWLKVDESELDPRYDSFVATSYDLDNTERELTDQITRMKAFGQWIAGLLCSPVLAWKPIRGYANIAGWLIALLTLPFLVSAVRNRQWLWLGAVVYVGALVINWPTPMIRYLVPAAPFLVLAIYQGIAKLTALLPARIAVLRTVMLNILFAAVLGTNGIIYLVEVAVTHSKNFYQRVEGGVHKQLIDAAWYLNALPQGDYEIAISQRWVYFGRYTTTDGFRRAMYFLTDRPLVTVDEAYCSEPDLRVVEWLRERNVKYYLYQPPYFLRWHFAAKSRNGIAITQADTEWRLYEIDEKGPRRIYLPATRHWPTHVPGLD